MPRFANLKGSMNPFDNNKPVLSSSDRIRNKKSKYIYAAAKQKFQTKRHCNGKNIKYYKKGTVRSVTNYKLQQDLAIGNTLCEDCDNKGTLCGPTERTNLNKIEMGNNKVSEFWGGGGIAFDLFGGLIQTGAFPVIQGDISGVWGGSNTDISKSIIGPDASLNFPTDPIPIPWGYVSNLINIPRNLNGEGIVIDPSNNLFPDDSCGFAPYLKHSNLKTYVIISAIIPLHRITLPGPPIVTAQALPGNCNDSSYNLLINNYITLFNLSGGPIVNGQIKSVCCKRNINIRLNTSFLTLMFPEGEFGLFDINIEVFQITDHNALSNLLNYKPPFLGNAVGTTTTGGWDWSYSSINPFVVLQTQTYLAFDIAIQSNLIESVKVIQGTVEPSFNQTKYNATKQSYLSCLEDGTKKINLTKNTMKNNIVKAYCKQ